MGSVFLDNVDDYLAPSQACVNPLFTSDRPKGDISKDANNGRNGTESNNISERRAVKPRRMRVRKKPQVGAAASLNSTNSDPMDIDNVLPNASLSTELPSARPSVSRKRPPSSSSGTRKPIALTYQTQNDDRAANSLPCPDSLNSATNPGQPTKKKATVSVADCLACSGCVTSAEAVLVQSHSISTLRKYVESVREGKESRLVVTISPASLADLIRHLYLNDDDINNMGNESNAGADDRQHPTPEEVLGRLSTFLHEELGANTVIDGTMVQQLSLVEAAEEFCARYTSKMAAIVNNGAGSGNENGVVAMDMDTTANDANITLTNPSIALSSTETRYLIQKDDGSGKPTTEGIVVQHPPGRDERLDQDGITGTHQSSPVLASSCPGFVCYVEKTAPAVIPNLSTAKSPMACAGVLVKHGADGNVSSANAKGVYHVAIMPCHDKKLEAGRKDLAWEFGSDSGDTIPDVDLVLTTSELFTLLSDSLSAKTKPAVVGQIAMPSVADEMDSPCLLRGHLEGFGIAQPYDVMPGRSTGSEGVTLISSSKKAISSPSNSTANTDSETVRMIGSGAYSEFIFRYAARKLFGFVISDEQPLPWKRVTRGGGAAKKSDNTNAPPSIRRRRAARGGSVAHSDMSEIILYKLSNGTYSLEPQLVNDIPAQPVLKFATAYGFKNVQLVLMKLGKRGEIHSGESSGAAHTPDYYDYIEVMACPSGCLNGGGQIRADEKGARRETPAETRQRVGRNRTIMNSIGLQSSVDLTSSPSSVVSSTYSSMPSGPFGAEAKKLLHTRFHVVPKLELSTGATAGVALDDTVW